MAIELERVISAELRSLGLNEKWLQDQIAADPTILGLGNLEIAAREHRQPVGGRIDFLMRDAEAKTLYEVEIMLGALDESHIIRTIEYWDIERQRRPQWDHRAVIVAEQITARFFNVLRLLNRSVPMIAIKMSAFKINDRVVLHPVVVLDVIEESAEQDIVDTVERADRAYWEKTWPAPVLAIVDKIVAALRGDGLAPRLTYNRSHIALGTTGRNFCWFNPRKSGNCFTEIRLTAERRDAALSTLEENHVDASPRGVDSLTLTIEMATLDEHFATIKSLLLEAEDASR